MPPKMNAPIMKSAIQPLTGPQPIRPLNIEMMSSVGISPITAFITMSIERIAVATKPALTPSLTLCIIVSVPGFELTGIGADLSSALAPADADRNLCRQCSLQK